MRPMDTYRATPRTLPFLLGAIALALVLLLALAPATTALASPTAGGDHGESLVLAAEERDRRPIAPTQRDQLGLLLYALMGISVVVGVATMRRQLKGDRPQTDGEFRWR